MNTPGAALPHGDSLIERLIMDDRAPEMVVNLLLPLLLFGGLVAFGYLLKVLYVDIRSICKKYQGGSRQK